jgi:molecular chaperone HscB
MDPFATLGLEPRFDLDLAAVEKTHRELSRALHPDKFVSASASERRAALAKAVEVNEAWRLVRDPIRRAEALLASKGVHVAEGGEPKADPEFLMEMLEQREALAEAKQARDVAALRRMEQAIEARSKAVEAALAAGFAGGEAASLVGRVGELRFYRRFLDEVSAIEDHFEEMAPGP